jgi:hypothetical protein
MKLLRAFALLMVVAGFSSALCAAGVPELDPGNMVSVGMLLSGVLLVVRAGRKK